MIIPISLLKNSFALAGVAQWIEHQPANGKATSWLPGQGACLGCGPGSPTGGVREATDPCMPHIGVSLPLFLPPFPSLKINKIFLKDLIFLSEVQNKEMGHSCSQCLANISCLCLFLLLGVLVKCYTSGEFGRGESLVGH